MRAQIDPHRCSRCRECLAREICPTKAILKIEPDNPAVIEQQYCYGCGDCVEKCLAKAIMIK